MAPAAKSEADIRVDIQKEDRCFSDYSLKIKSSTITKRQTNQDDKTDYVWVELTAENDAFTYQAEYELMYVLYNDGWLLEKFKNTASDIIPLSYPTLEEATALFCNNEACRAIFSAEAQKVLPPTWQYVA